MVHRDEVVRKIDDLIGRMSGPFSEEDIKGGWNENERKGFLAFFGDLKGKVLKGERIGDLHMSRRMDAWGIVEGPLLELAEIIGEDVENLERG